MQSITGSANPQVWTGPFSTTGMAKATPAFNPTKSTGSRTPTFREVLLELARFAPGPFKVSPGTKSDTRHYNATSATGYINAVHWAPSNSSHTVDVTGTKEVMNELHAWLEDKDLSVTWFTDCGAPTIRFWVKP